MVLKKSTSSLCEANRVLNRVEAKSVFRRHLIGEKINKRGKKNTGKRPCAKGNASRTVLEGRSVRAIIGTTGQKERIGSPCY